MNSPYDQFIQRLQQNMRVISGADKAEKAINTAMEIFGRKDVAESVLKKRK